MPVDVWNLFCSSWGAQCSPFSNLYLLSLGGRWSLRSKWEGLRSFKRGNSPGEHSLLRKDPCRGYHGKMQKLVSLTSRFLLNTAWKWENCTFQERCNGRCCSSHRVQLLLPPCRLFPSKILKAKVWRIWFFVCSGFILESYLTRFPPALRTLGVCSVFWICCIWFLMFEVLRKRMKLLSGGLPGAVAGSSGINLMKYVCNTDHIHTKLIDRDWQGLKCCFYKQRVSHSGFFPRSTGRPMGALGNRF